MNLKPLLFLLFMFLAFADAFSKNVNREKDIPYIADAKDARHFLDVTYPEREGEAKDVIVFIHGGSWNSGKKDIYWWLGRNFASKGVVEVNINYSLSPRYEYQQMASDVASALKWVSTHIAQYNGNPKRIFVMGHSAGGQLAELVNSDPRFFDALEIDNPIKGIILNDAFGLNIYDYLFNKVQGGQTESFLVTFGDEAESWKMGSPISYVENISNPHLILTGQRTYPTIQTQSRKLFEVLHQQNTPARFEVIKGKKHIGMISQMLWRGNRMYDVILDFMAAVK